MRENFFQSEVIKNLREVFPGCVILKNDASYMQGVPDLIILFNDRWAMLEVKSSSKAKVQPNQRFYIKAFDRMSYAAFIYPENEAEVFYELQQAFKPRRSARVSKRQSTSLG